MVCLIFLLSKGIKSSGWKTTLQGKLSSTQPVSVFSHRKVKSAAMVTTSHWEPAWSTTNSIYHLMETSCRGDDFISKNVCFNTDFALSKNVDTGTRYCNMHCTIHIHRHGFTYIEIVLYRDNFAFLKEKKQKLVGWMMTSPVIRLLLRRLNPI